MLFEDEEIKVDIPRKLLPLQAREGSRLNVTFDVDEEGTKRQEEKVK